MTVYSEHQTTRREAKQHWRRIIMSAAFRVSLMVWVAVFGFLYLAETTAVSTQGYALSDLERSIGELESANRRLSVEVARYQSMRSIQERLGGANLVDAGPVEYLTGSAVVVKR
ncbi:MAG: hypothetical protein UY92_C0022G0003 [Candidatus Magasanikbacteria bacterium GW2011_GWA2_56_11]|uniref:Cell division protein FtsL n=1 Tax=Candidatus Magasanikbacteria bacterium GW2011_GWA2_56_11 TaxID=1619044 RepID=A0A0G1YCV3_9BACT|nr:MAG: hypothetical protein UY92_C0022G0003 [Candidatus Magasanikbacteria bacterium GW2011_GWA2_56_11]